MKLFICLFLGVSFTGVLAEKVRYDNHTLYRLVPQSKQVVQRLVALESAAPSGYNFFSPVRGENIPVDVLVSPVHLEEFKSLLEDTDIQNELLVPNLQKLIDYEEFRPQFKTGAFDWKSYYTLDEIYQWLRSLASTYPDRVRLLIGGQTHEGRDILGVKLSFKPNNERHTVFIEANIHAREWITSAVATFLINQLISSNDSDIRDLAESHDWYIFPVFNPDGFVFSHDSDRLWRKTRKRYSPSCYGVDPNRNWPYEWMHGGASDQPCSDIYAGPNPLSEESTESMARFINSLGDTLEAYISFHSYSQLLLLPYGHTTAHLDNYDELLKIGKKAAQDLSQRYGTQYVVGNIAETIYVATGGSMDWVKHKYKVPISYTYELRDTGTYGFLLPAKQIIPTALETIDSLVSIFKSYKELHSDS